MTELAVDTAESQRRRALARADEVRSRRGRIKRLMAEGRITLGEVFAADKEHLATMPVRDLLRSVPGLGEARIRRAMRANSIGHFMELHELSFRRRAELVIWLEQHYPSVVVR